MPAPPTPPSFTTLEVLTSSDMNKIRDDLTFLITPPALRVYSSTNLTIGTAALTALLFDSERYKTDSGMHSNTTNKSRMTCTVAGKYLFTVHGAWAAVLGGVRQHHFRLNGTTDVASFTDIPGTNLYTSDFSFSTVYNMAVNDYMEVTVYQDSGGNINVSTRGNDSPEATMTWLGT